MAAAGPGSIPLARIFAASPTAAGISTLAEGRWLFVNEALAAFYHLTPGDIVGRTSVELGFWPDLGGWAELTRELRERGYSRDRLVRPMTVDGESRAVVVAMDVIEYEGQECVLTQHISPPGEAPLAVLELSEQRFARVFHSNLFGFSISTVTEGAFLLVNDQFLVMFGLAREAVEGKTVFDTGHWEDQAARARFAERLREKQEIPRRDFEYRRSDGKRLWITASHEVIEYDGRECILSIYEDVTDARLAENALRDADQFRDLVLASTTEAIFALDGRGRFTMVNPAGERLGGYPEAELLGEPYFVFFDEDDMATVYELLARALSGGEAVRGFETRVRHRDGHWLNVAVSAAPIIAEGVFVGVVGSAVDISERKRAEEAMVAARKLESLAALAGGVAHDFNNLLVGILGNASLALAQLEPGERGHTELLGIEESAKRAAELAKQMLSYSGHGNFILTSLDVSRLIGGMGSLLQASVGRTVRVETRAERGVPSVQADEGQLQQLVVNLVLNASDAIGQGDGDISVSTGLMHASRAYLDGCYLAPAIAEGEYVYIEVSDNGPGMDEVTRSRIFDPFYTTRFPGRGLGLAAVLGIVRAHSGAIAVTSEPARGSTFRVLFPAARDAASNRPTDKTGSPSLLILVIDDEAVVRTLATRALTTIGFTVITASDGVEGVERFRESGGEIGCVLMDMTMPRLDGEGALRAIREIRPDARVVLMSGYDRDSTLRRFPSDRVDGFLQKPFDLKALRATITSVMGAPA